jgi:small subunit ribosomal protein S18
METKSKTANIEHYDYKDIVRLRAHLNPHARMFNRRRTGHSASEQRAFAQAVKRARFMALVPYVCE